jgi:hypothetical protein
MAMVALNMPQAAEGSLLASRAADLRVIVVGSTTAERC